MTRNEALALMEEYVSNPRLRQHMLAVEIAMRGGAQREGGDPDEWGLAGLLHDFDWEIHPTAAEHPAKGQAILTARGVPPAIRQAIMAHAPHTGVQPKSAMDTYLLAVDELVGFIIACALVQPNRTLAEVTVASVQKKLRTASFAAAVSRDDIARGCELLKLPPEQHIANVLHDLQTHHQQIGL